MYRYTTKHQDTIIEFENNFYIFNSTRNPRIAGLRRFIFSSDTQEKISGKWKMVKQNTQLYIQLLLPLILNIQ